MFKTLAAAVMAVALLLSPAAHADETPPTPSETAMAFAGQFSDKHLSGMLSRIGARQQSLVAMSQIQGGMVAIVFDLQIDVAVEKYSSAWQINMANAWAPLLSEEEMTSLMAEGSASPHAARYGEAAPQAGQNMQELSGDLFNQILGEVVEATLTELGAETPSQ